MNLQDITKQILIEYLNKQYRPRNAVFETVYQICMDTYSGKRLYLSNDNLIDLTKPLKYLSFGWTEDALEGMIFDTEAEAKALAEKYFKHFDRWYIYKNTIYDGSV